MPKLKFGPHDDVLFTSDTHAHHKNILKFCPKSRQGKDSTEMTNIMIDNWNNQAGPDTIIFHLGDVSFGSSQDTINFLNRIQGKIHLVLGNHDKEDFLRKTGRFESVSYYQEITVRGIPWVLFHYPIYEWNWMHHGSVHLYGHVHGRHLKDLPEGRSMDVGIDTRTDMKLWTVPEIHARVNNKPIRGHHEGPQ